jgi:SAM-dependent methyltransferase
MHNNNTIYRCYPKKNNHNHYYEAIDIRYDKVKPNKHNIAVIIMDLYNLEYKYEYEYVYNNSMNYSMNNTKHINNIEWKNIIDSNSKILQIMLNKMNINMHSINNVLDLGCGSGKLLKYLKNYNSYVGVDVDNMMIAKAINMYSNNMHNNINFMYCDLNKEWPQIMNNKFDTVFMINSLMHFNSELFWGKLNNIINDSTKILLNLVEMEDNYKYEFGDSFMERKGNKIYYKFPIHNSIKEEQYIDINELKKNWTIIETYKIDNNNLTKFYRWYIITKGL